VIDQTISIKWKIFHELIDSMNLAESDGKEARTSGIFRFDTALSICADIVETGDVEAQTHPEPGRS